MIAAEGASSTRASERSWPRPTARESPVCSRHRLPVWLPRSTSKIARDRNALGTHSGGMARHHAPLLAILRPNLKHGQGNLCRLAVGDAVGHQLRSHVGGSAVDAHDLAGLVLKVRLALDERINAFLLGLGPAGRVAVDEVFGKELLELRAVSRLRRLVECHHG